MPAWCGRDGLPLSWAHYVHGRSYLARAEARRQLALAEAMRLAQSIGDSFADYQRNVQARTEPR